MKIFLILVIGLALFLSCNNKGKQNNDNEDTFRQEYRHNSQTQSIYESEDDYVEDRMLEENNLTKRYCI